jgi:hypothetical protein
MRGLAAGRSFVTTGPMMFARVKGQWPGATFPATNPSQVYPLQCTVRSEQPLESVELIVNGSVTQRFDPQNKQTAAGSFETEVATNLSPKESSWLAWRCFERRPGGRSTLCPRSRAAETPTMPSPRAADSWAGTSRHFDYERSRGVQRHDVRQVELAGKLLSHLRRIDPLRTECGSGNQRHGSERRFERGVKHAQKQPITFEVVCCCQSRRRFSGQTLTWHPRFPITNYCPSPAPALLGWLSG